MIGTNGPLGDFHSNDFVLLAVTLCTSSHHYSRIYAHGDKSGSAGIRCHFIN